MKQFNNKILAIALLVLVVVFVLTRVFRSSRVEGNLETDLFHVDTAKITALKIYVAKDQRQELKLTEQGKKWNVTQAQKTFPVEANSVNELLSALSNVKVQRMVSRKKEKWNTYEVDDSTGTRVIIQHGEDVLADWWVGKQNFSPPSAGMYDIKGFTYIRKNEEGEVYSIEGSLSSIITRSLNDWRDKTFLQVDKEKISKITFQYPSDSSFVLEKKNNEWFADNEKADSSQVANYLNGLQMKKLYSFSDSDLPTANPDLFIRLEGNAVLGEIKAWRKESDHWILNSTAQPETYFSSEGSSVIADLFVGKSRFVFK